MRSRVFYFLICCYLSIQVSAELPHPPADCFDDRGYCYQTGVIYHQKLARRVIHVDFHARLEAESYLQIVDLFLSFGSWEERFFASLKNYSSVKMALSEHDVVFAASKELDPVTIDGVEGRVQYSDCWSRGPWPMAAVHVVEQTIHLPTDIFPGALYSSKFIQDPSFTGTKGFKFKEGYFHVIYDQSEQVYLVYTNLDVIAEFDFLPTVAAPYVAKGMVAIFKGAFSDLF